MATRKVKLKNKGGDYLYPYTDNIPTATTSKAGIVKLDSSATSGSNNAITSGTVYTVLNTVNTSLNSKLGKTETAAKATADANGNTISTTYALQKQTVTTLATSGTISLTDNSVNRIIPAGTVTFSLPAISDNTIFHQILVQMTLSAVHTINLGANVYFGGEAPTFEAAKYNIVYEHNGTNWVVGAIKIA